MDNYVKGKCVEEPLERNSIPIPNLSENFLWMQVKGGSKTQRLIEHASSILDSGDTKHVVWTGSGDGVMRTIACVETIKRSRKLYQITKIGYKKCEEFWEPKQEGLDQLVVCREIPIIHILVSPEPLNPEESGYQPPDNEDVFWKTSGNNAPNKKKEKKRPKVSPDEIAAMGLQSNTKRSFRNNKKTKS